jgi:hypothetical protein
MRFHLLSITNQLYPGCAFSAVCVFSWSQQRYYAFLTVVVVSFMPTPVVGGNITMHVLWLGANMHY